MRKHGRHNGFTLIECLVYIFVLAAVTGLAFSAFYRAYTNSTNLRRNADDIERTLKAGERWRADVRSATDLPHPIDGGVAIPQRSGDVAYWFANGTVWRMAGPNKTAALTGVKSSGMHLDRREHVVSWRWEVELASAQKMARVRPLFTFQAASKPQPNHDR